MMKGRPPHDRQRLQFYVSKINQDMEGCVHYITYDAAGDTYFLWRKGEDSNPCVGRARVVVEKWTRPAHVWSFIARHWKELAEEEM